MPAFVHLISMPGRILAEPIVQLLRANGIDAFIHADDSGGVDPALGMVHGAQIRVASHQLKEAQQLLAAYEQAPLVENEDPTW